MLDNALKTILCLFLLFSLSNAQTEKKIPVKDNSSKTDYENLWIKVDDLEDSSRIKSALRVADDIFQKAKKENNFQQTIKSMLVKYSLKSSIEENKASEFISELRKAIEKARAPHKNILNSILACSYQQYYNDNRYRILQRSRVEQSAAKGYNDFKVWDASRFQKEITKLFLASLDNAELLITIPSSEYSELLEQNNNYLMISSSTLLDVLAGNALAYFEDTEYSVFNPAEKFEIKDAAYLGMRDEFLKVKAEIEDTLSLKYQACKMFQMLISYHINKLNTNSSKKSLAQIDVMRLNYIHGICSREDKDSLSLSTLKKSALRSQDINESAVYWLKLSENYKIFSDDNTLSGTKSFVLNAMAICDSMLKVNLVPDEAIKFKILKNKILEKSLSFNCQQIVAAEKPFGVLFDHQNVDTVFLSIIPMNSENKKLLEKNTDKIDSIYSMLKDVTSFTSVLRSSKDYLGHTTEVTLPKLKAGSYMLLASDNKKYECNSGIVSHSEFCVSNIALLTKDYNGQFELIVTNRSTGNPEKDVNIGVYVYKRYHLVSNLQYILDSTLTTNENGQAVIKSNYHILKLILSKDSDTLVVNDFYESSKIRVDSSTIEKTFLFTDRSIYRPGQKLFFNGLKIAVNQKDETSSVVAGNLVKVTLYEANRQALKEIEIKTNEFGTVSGEFDIPLGRNNGQWRISAEGTSEYFRVEEYKRPQFEVTLDPQNKNIALNDTVTVSGKAATFSNAPLSNASVNYTVTRYKEMFYRSYLSQDRQNQTNIASGKILTDNNGNFSIKFTAQPGKNNIDKNIVYSYTVNVTVTDATGETHEIQKDLKAGYKDLFLNSDMEGILNSEDNKAIKFSASNIDGLPTEAKVNAVIYRLEMPQYTLVKRPWSKPEYSTSVDPEADLQALPDSTRYIDEYPITDWKKLDTVFSRQITLKGDSLIFLNEKRSWKPGKYLLVLSAAGKNAETKFEKYFDLFSPAAKTTPANTPLLVNVLTPVVKQGSSVSIAAGTSLKEIKVFYEIETQYGFKHKTWISLLKGQTILNLPVDSTIRGEIALHFVTVYENKIYSSIAKVLIQKPETKLNIAFESFRNKILPGSHENWKLKIKMPDSTNAHAQMMAAMYDISLDAFINHNWYLNLYPDFHLYSRSWTMQDENYNSSQCNIYESFNDSYFSDYLLPTLNLWGFQLDNEYSAGSVYKSKKYKKMQKDDILPVLQELYNTDPDGNSDRKRGSVRGVDYSLIEVNEVRKPDMQIVSEDIISPSNGVLSDKKNIEIRKDLQETAFFYPNLVTDKEGNITISFISPGSLTRWKFMALAHTKDMFFNTIEKEIITRKEIMIQANAPRFLRQGDTIYFSVRISNLSDSSQSGVACLNLFNAANGEPIDSLLENHKTKKSFLLSPNESMSLSWRLIIPSGSINLVTWRASALTDLFTDGEEAQLPVLTNTQLITESMPVELNGFAKGDFVFKKITENSSTTLRPHKLTFEFTSNPVWNAIQSLPYLMEYPYECSEQTFSRFFANSLASFLVNSNPKIKQVFENWKNNIESVLKSNLFKNQELKNIILEETPWLRDAQNETSLKQNIALLFDVIRLANEKSACGIKLQKAQQADGGWPWFNGMPSSLYITQHIIAGFGHLNKLGILDLKTNAEFDQMLKRAITYCDQEMYLEYKRLIKIKDLPKNFSPGETVFHYLYARSYFPDVPVSSGFQEAVSFWNQLANKSWNKENKYIQGMIALSAFRSGNSILAKTILNSLKESAFVSDQMGMYFTKNSGWYWYEAPIETQSLMIEAFDEISKDTISVDLMKKWLLKQKQTTNWGTTRATAEACYALIQKGSDWISETKLPDVIVGDQKLQISNDSAEAGTGYFKISWNGSEIKPGMSKFHIENNNAVPAWGSVYWQYFEQLDKVTQANTQLSINKQVCIETEDKYGKKLIPVEDTTILKPGDMLKIRIELRTGRDMEYVHMKDMRASGFEPVNVLSVNKYQDGLWYYESTKDAATNFFFEYLRKGTYVFEYPLRVVYKGAFSNGITTIQCMYAPEFTSHSEGKRMRVE
ncbi:MAG: alpha-2-macroglobulin family protein [Bacillota bacterium]